MSLVKTRERRANAGNRMRALLEQEMEADELFQEEDDDNEFEFKGEEEDIVDSDFDASSDDNEHTEEQEAMELDKKLEKEDKKKKFNVPALRKRPPPPPRTARSAPKKTVAASNKSESSVKRVRITNTPTAPPVSVAILANARKSSRSATVASRALLENSLRRDEERRAALPKRQPPVEVRKLTQAELLAEAAETEKLNTASLKSWQELEAERLAKLKKQQGEKVIRGEFVRFHSFMEGRKDDHPVGKKVMVVEMVPAVPESGRIWMNRTRRLVHPDVVEWMAREEAFTSSVHSRNIISFENFRRSTLTTTSNPNGTTTSTSSTNANTTTSVSDDSSSNQQDYSSFNRRARTEKEFMADIPPPLLSWFTSRPTHHPKKPLICPITGLTARYRDPLTGVPYANKDAFSTLRAVLCDNFVWSSGVSSYVSVRDERGANGVPQGWERACAGVPEGEDDWPEMIEGGVPAWVVTARAKEEKAKIEKEKDRKEKADRTAAKKKEREEKGEGKEQRILGREIREPPRRKGLRSSGALDSVMMLPD